jgi:hypothetical protein
MVLLVLALACLLLSRPRSIPTPQFGEDDVFGRSEGVGIERVQAAEVVEKNDWGAGCRGIVGLEREAVFWPSTADDTAAPIRWMMMGKRSGCSHRLPSRSAEGHPRSIHPRIVRLE